MKRILLALGGNALGDSSEEQEELTRKTSETIVDLIEKGYELIVTHGNGPQVGMINSGLKDAKIPLAECIAMSQGYIGYHLEKALREELEKRQIDRGVAVIITQVLVDPEDIAFKNPSKPIGRYYSEKEAEDLREKFIIKNDSNRGYRRYIASPKPLKVLESALIGRLVDQGRIVIAGGGGGIPVVKKADRYVGVDGVIDKDFTSEVLAQELGADYLIILTQVDQVSINFGCPDEEKIRKSTTGELRKLVDRNEFAEGSMLPKIEASISFVDSQEGRAAIITSIDMVAKALEGRAGTLIYRDK